MQSLRALRRLAAAGVCAALATGMGLVNDVARADTITSCNLTFGAAYIDGTGGIDGLNEATGVTTYGNHVYVVSSGDKSLLALLRHEDGSLTYSDLQEKIEFPYPGLDAAAGVVVSPDGAHIYTVAGGADKAVSKFTLMGGLLQYLEDDFVSDAGLAGASGIAMAPDGKNIYATGATGDAVVSLTRDTITGALTFLEHVQHVDFGLDGVSAVAVSPDNNHVYTVGKLSSALTHFDRDPITGELEYVEKQLEGGNNVDGLSAPTALVISPDGAYVYTAASATGEIGKFTRNASTGEVDFVRIEANGLTGLTSLEISPDGAQFYATSTTASTNGVVRVFSRNTGNGELTSDTTLVDSSTSDPLKLRQPTDVAVSADGLSVYVTSKKDKAISTFLAFSPSGTVCEAGNNCTDDTCNGTGTCVTGPCHLGQSCVDPSCALGLCDDTGGPCVCKKTP